MSWAIRESTEQPLHLRGFQSNFPLELGASRGSPGGPAEWLSRRRPGSSSGGKERELRGAMMPSMEVVYFSGIVTSQMSPLTSALNTALGEGNRYSLWGSALPSHPAVLPPSLLSFLFPVTFLSSGSPGLHSPSLKLFLIVVDGHQRALLCEWLCRDWKCRQAGEEDEQALTEEPQNLRSWEGAWMLPPAVVRSNYTWRNQGSRVFLSPARGHTPQQHGKVNLSPVPSHSANSNCSLHRAHAIQGPPPFPFKLMLFTNIILTQGQSTVMEHDYFEY